MVAVKETYFFTLMVMPLIRIPGFNVGIIIIKTKAVAMYLDTPD